MSGNKESQGNHLEQASEPEWLHTHVHEPNPDPPSDDPAFDLSLPGQPDRKVTIDDLARLPQREVGDCTIVSTGHGTSGPFVFGGVRLADFVAASVPAGTTWREVDVISVDGFGNRVRAEEMAEEDSARPILLATRLDGEPMTRAQGLVRMIVPSETDDALRQVKWIGRIDVR